MPESLTHITGLSQFTYLDPLEQNRFKWGCINCTGEWKTPRPFRIVHLDLNNSESQYTALIRMYTYQSKVRNAISTWIFFFKKVTMKANLNAENEPVLFVEVYIV